MFVTAQLVASEMISHAARILGPRIYHFFFQADEGIDQLEDRTGRIWRLHGTVEHRLVRIGGYLAIMFSDVCEHLYVYSRAGNHGKDLAGRRLDSHETSHLVVHQLLSIVLQMCINGGGYILSRHRLLVLGTALISGHDLVA